MSSLDEDWHGHYEILEMDGPTGQWRRLSHRESELDTDWNVTQNVERAASFVSNADVNERRLEVEE